MALYLKTQDLIDYLRALRMNRKINASPYMDNALLNIQQLLEIDQYNPCIFDYVEIGNCEKCKDYTGRFRAIAEYLTAHCPYMEKCLSFCSPSML